jgi:hypothetical protein
MPASFDQWVPGVSAELDGAPAHLLLDTGAPLTLLDSQRTGLAIGGHEVDLTLAELAFPALPVLALDLLAYQQTRQPLLDGIVGGDVLTSFALSLDYRGETVWLEEDPLPVPDGAEASVLAPAIELAARVSGGGEFRAPGAPSREVGATRFLVRARVEDLDQELWMLVDSGASAVVLSGELLETLGDPGRPRLDGVTVGTAAGLVTAYFTRVWSLRLQGASGGGEAVELTSAPVLVLDDDDLFAAISSEVGERVQGIVGGTYLRWFLTTMDYPGKTLRLHRYTAADHIDPDEYVGVGFSLEQSGERWEVGVVYPGTDAAVEGLRPGDEVVALDGTALSGLGRAEVAGLTEGFQVGDEIPVQFARAGNLIDVLVSVEDLLPEFEAPR